MIQFPTLMQYAVYISHVSPVYRLSVPMVFDRQDLVETPSGRKVRNSKIGRSHVIAERIKKGTEKSRLGPLVMIQSACPHDEPCLIEWGLDNDAPIILRAETVEIAFRKLGYYCFTFQEDALDWWLESRAALSHYEAERATD